MTFSVIEGDVVVASGDKGTAVSAPITSNPINANVEALHVDGSNVTQPISAASLPLPAGAATETTLEAVRALLATIDADTSNLDVALSTRATEATLQAVEALLTSLDGKDFATEAKLEAVRALVASLDGKDFATETTLAAADAKLGTIDSVLDAIKDTDGVKKITDPLPSGTNEIGAVAQGTKAAPADAWPVVGYDAAGNPLTAIEGQTLIAAQPGYVILGKNNLTDVAYIPTVKIDPIDGERRISVAGKISVTSPIPPANTTPVTVAADSPLSVVGTSTTSYVITNGTTLTIQSIIIGAEGDTTGGHKIEIFFWDGITESLIDRFYINADSFGFYPDTSITRDGTPITGNGTNEIRIRRIRLSGGSKEIDVVLRGFEQ